MGTYRVCKTFTVESGHMLSRHPERCRFPHGHTRRIEIVVVGEKLDDRAMLVDFKALKLALETYVERYDHAMAVNSEDPLLPALRASYPEDAVIVFEGEDPTTEVLARDIFGFLEQVLTSGFESGPYRIRAGSIRAERVRVWETPSSWAEYGI